ncbi:hypothetical protein [Motilimonas eburnea]|uniref:hypothetical protein n=1 Tax=Motilimonas eburnea TaxID=1737488 RepID=UPI001E3E0C28|nr:hypothetical protein [Motilimonas eburnea]MCE2571707.1 hypothetical protein [Motilimonas eburnea]
MKKLLMLASAALLAACNTTGENTYYANDGYEFSPDPTKSLALNVMQAGGTTRLLKDADIPAEAWDDVSTAQYATGFTIQFLQNGILGGISSLIIDSNIDDAAPLDWPNYVAWIPVSSSGFSASLQKEAFNKNIANIESSLRNHGAVITVSEQRSSFYSIEYQGTLCDKATSIVLKANPSLKSKIDSGRVKPCIMNLYPEVIRPAKKSISSDNKGDYIVVRTKFVSVFEFGVINVIPEGYFVYVPPRWGTPSLMFNTGYPSVRDNDNIYLFIEPNNGNQAKLSKL